MEHNKDLTPVASQPVDATAPTHELSSTTPTPETTENATTTTETTRSVAIPATEDQVQPIASDAVPPPQYERYARFTYLDYTC